MKITREQIKKWNEGCKNDFRVDVQYLLYHNEKTLEKIVELDSKHYLKAHISFYNKYENFRSVGYYINVNVSIWYHEENSDFASSSGLGINFKVNDVIYEKRTFKDLQKATEYITSEKMIAIYEADRQSKNQLENAVIVG